MEFHRQGQRVATGAKELTESGSFKAETIFEMHFTSSVTRGRIDSEFFLLQKVMLTKTMARILKVGSQNPACKLKT